MLQGGKRNCPFHIQIELLAFFSPVSLCTALGPKLYVLRVVGTMDRVERRLIIILSVAFKTAKKNEKKNLFTRLFLNVCEKQELGKAFLT